MHKFLNEKDLLLNLMKYYLANAYLSFDNEKPILPTVWKVNSRLLISRWRPSWPIPQKQRSSCFCSLKFSLVSISSIQNFQSTRMLLCILAFYWQCISILFSTDLELGNMVNKFQNENALLAAVSTRPRKQNFCLIIKIFYWQVFDIKFDKIITGKCTSISC